MQRRANAFNQRVRQGEIGEFAGWRKQQGGEDPREWEANLRIGVILHGTTFAFCLSRREDREQNARHTTGVLVSVGDEGKSAFSARSGPLFNHVPRTSQARLIKQEPRGFARMM